MRKWLLRSRVVLFAALLLSFNCDGGPGAESPLSPPPTSGDLLGLPKLRILPQKKDAGDSEGKVDGEQKGSEDKKGSEEKKKDEAAPLILIETDQQTTQTFVSSILGLLGGELSSGGHSIVVPRGAVLEATLFTLKVPASRTIGVELEALVPGFGVLSSLGWFRRPVTLEMSYDGAKGPIDPDHLVIVRLLDDGRLEVMPTKVDRKRKVITTELEHFSRYAMASN